MRFLKILILLGAILTNMSGCAAITQNSDTILRGNVIHSFKNGKVQCLSQTDSSGQVTILLKSLSDNTTFEFKELFTKGDSYVLTGMIYVKADTDICLAWIDAQPLAIEINPEPVECTTLTGKQIYANDGVTVLSEN